MPTSPAEQAAQQQRARANAGGGRRRPRGNPRMPSTAGYMFVAGSLSVALFWIVWALLRSDGDEAPWIPAGLAAGFVILFAAFAREVVMRRAWSRYTREMEMVMGAGDPARVAFKPQAQAKSWPGMQAQVAALRTLQQRLSELDTPSTPPESHLEAYKLCEQYLANTDEALRAPGGAAEMRAALRSGQERVRAYQRKHFLAWARGEATRLTHEAQRRVRHSDRIETAQRALEVVAEALRAYPGEREFVDSSTALKNFIASVKVGQWVEMAERAAFRGKYSRAVARYRDALFYLSRADMSEDARDEAANRIQREIEMLRARMRTAEMAEELSRGLDDDGAGARRVVPRDEGEVSD
ncbi:MAG: hypothetical protein JOZ96_23035 [Acidobacteria bacterium]|nr:hypothetical protein [Acidobacteriota bacterium]